VKFFCCSVVTRKEAEKENRETEIYESPLLRHLVVEFQDGLQIILTNWLTNDLKRAKWPNCYITSNRYDKAVKYMEEPQSTWEEHPIVKIFTSCCKLYYILHLFVTFIFQKLNNIYFS